MFTFSGLIDRSYRSRDEAITPFCITFDGQTKEDCAVTVRQRDSMEQIRVSTDQLLGQLREKLDL
jgi:glycyl-tRNA synthetase